MRELRIASKAAAEEVAWDDSKKDTVSNKDISVREIKWNLESKQTISLKSIKLTRPWLNWKVYLWEKNTFYSEKVWFLIWLEKS